MVRLCHPRCFFFPECLRETRDEELCLLDRLSGEGTLPWQDIEASHYLDLLRGSLDVVSRLVRGSA